MSKGQTITGQLTCAPNTRNNRDLDIVITHKTNADEETRIQYKMCVFSPFSLFLSFLFLVVLCYFLNGTKVGIAC
jgi:hypothetical protein